MAVCLQLAHDQKTKDPLYEINKWLDITLRTTQHTRKTERINEEYFLIYKIFEKRNVEYSDIAFYKTKMLKNGSLGKGIKIELHNLTYGHNHYDIKSALDSEILELCGARLNKYGHYSAMLVGSLGYLILQKLIESKRCFCDDSLEPIKISDEIKSISFWWENINLNSSKIASNLTKNQLLLNTDPQMILDFETRLLYHTDKKYDQKLISALQESPLFPTEITEKLYEKLHTHCDTLPLSLPHTIEKKVIDSTPQVVLKIFTYFDEDRRYYMASLYFDYEGEILAHHLLGEKSSFIKNKIAIEIIRDLPFEESAKMKMIEFGFELFIEKFVGFAAPLFVWEEFLDLHTKELENEGWKIEFDQSFHLQFIKDYEIEMESSQDESNDWFSLTFELKIGGVSRPLAPLLAPLLEQYDSFEEIPHSINLEIEPDRYANVQKEEFASIIKTIFELFDKQDEDGVLKIAPYDAHLLDLDEDIIWKREKELKELSKKLKNFEGIKEVIPPKELNATLQEYQQFGLNWLGFLDEFNFCGILADDMGLGKTLQTLAHIAKLKEDEKLSSPTLIIMPTSLVANWKNEVKKFTPNLSFLALHGNERFDHFETIGEYDLIFTTYTLITRDFDELEKYHFEYIILDEAQKIKNPKTKVAMLIKQLKSKKRLALSGTPIENHLGELWSIFSFLMPGFLDTASAFRNIFQIPIEKEHNKERNELLNRKIKPFILRRTKEDVVLELPEKTEIIKYTSFEPKQAKLYETIRVTMEQKVKEVISKKGLNRSRITILDALLKLRQVCCDPSLLKLKEAQKVKDSAKVELFMDLIEELLEEKRKILVFSQFTSMLEIIMKKLFEKEIKFSILTGSTTNREAAIEEFTSGRADIFLISLKAGVLGSIL